MNSGPLQAYYKAAYAAVRKHSSGCFVAIAPRVYEQDGSEWQHFMTGPGYTNVLQDLHRCALRLARVSELIASGKSFPSDNRGITTVLLYRVSCASAKARCFAGSKTSRPV